MTRLLCTFIPMFSLAATAVGQPTDSTAIEKFNAFLGVQEAAALDEAIASYDYFLTVNFPNEATSSERAEAFLTYWALHNDNDSSWNINTAMNKKILESWESSGLRRDLRLHENESYEPSCDVTKYIGPVEYKQDSITDLGDLELDLIEEDIVPISSRDSLKRVQRERDMKEELKKALWTNVNGKFLFGLAKYSLDIPFVRNYVEVMHEGFQLSPGVLAIGFLSSNPDFEEPFVKRIIVAEFYWLTMRKDLEEH